VEVELAEYIGPDTVHVGMHMEVQQGLPVEGADRIAEEVRERVQQATGCQYCIIHVMRQNWRRLSDDSDQEAQ